MNKNISKRGRPTLPKSERRSHVRCFVMNEDESRLLDDVCNRYGITMSNAIRFCIGYAHDGLFHGEFPVEPKHYA